MVCLYHSWSYDKTGDLVFVPDLGEMRSCSRAPVALDCLRGADVRMPYHKSCGALSAMAVHAGAN